MQKLNGLIIALSRFMSKLVKKCLPFYKVLMKDKSSRWSKDCEKTFMQLKKYLSSPPVLTRPKVGEILFLYIVMSDKAVGTVLIIERNGEQMMVYYTSKVLHGAKVRYQKIKKLAYTIILA